MAQQVSDVLELHLRRAKPRAENVPQIMPAEITKLRFLDAGLKPLPRGAQLQAFRASLPGAGLENYRSGAIAGFAKLLERYSSPFLEMKWTTRKSRLTAVQGLDDLPLGVVLPVHIAGPAAQMQS
jgi:hypothetical protein